MGWRRGIAITFFGGLPLALWSYIGYVYVPLGHGAIIQPSCAALGGLILARLVVKEPLPPRRIVGALAMLAGLAVIGAEALRTMGGQGRAGRPDVRRRRQLFCRLRHAAAAVAHSGDAGGRGDERAVARRPAVPAVRLSTILWPPDSENLMQAVVQGAFAGAGAIYLFTRAVILLGVGRAALFPALVPPFTLLIGYLTLGEVPSVSQFIGLAIVLIGFRLTQQA